MKCVLFVILCFELKKRWIWTFCSKKKNQRKYISAIFIERRLDKQKNDRNLKGLHWNLACLSVSTDILFRSRISLWMFKSANIYARRTHLNNVRGRRGLTFVVAVPSVQVISLLSRFCPPSRCSFFRLPPLCPALSLSCLIPLYPRLSSTHNCPRGHIAGAREGTRGHETSYAHSYSREERERERNEVEETE